jgi:peptidoglycan/LPS O-acetylase OafA/YrhL
MPSRDNRIDILRFIGLAMIILAHVSPPEVIFRVRNFDVPLMIIVSGLSFRASYRQENYLVYLWKRVKRLLFPVWLFLTVFFLEIFITGYPIPLLSAKKIISSFLLLDGQYSGIGYVWIVRVFILIAIFSPFLLSFCKRIKSHRKYLTLLIAILVIYEMILAISKPYLNTLQGYFLEETIFCLVPFAVVFSLGLRLSELSRKSLLSIAAIAFSIFSIEAITLGLMTGHTVSTQDFKYPPQMYYLSYAVFVAVLLWVLSHKLSILFDRLKVSPIILFIAQNSLWIYLWHIPLIEIIRFPFYFKYPLVFAVASLMTLLQVGVVKKIILPKIKSPSFKRNIVSLLTG